MKEYSGGLDCHAGPFPVNGGPQRSAYNLRAWGSSLFWSVCCGHSPEMVKRLSLKWSQLGFKVNTPPHWDEWEQLTFLSAIVSVWLAIASKIRQQYICLHSASAIPDGLKLHCFLSGSFDSGEYGNVHGVSVGRRAESRLSHRHLLLPCKLPLSQDKSVTRGWWGGESKVYLKSFFLATWHAHNNFSASPWLASFRKWQRGRTPLVSTVWCEGREGSCFDWTAQLPLTSLSRKTSLEKTVSPGSVWDQLFFLRSL